MLKRTGTDLFEASDKVVVGLRSREAESGLRSSQEDGTRGQDREASRGHPTFRVESVHSQGDLKERYKREQRH